jgi:hypothetical protein
VTNTSINFAVCVSTLLTLNFTLVEFSYQTSAASLVAISSILLPFFIILFPFLFLFVLFSRASKILEKINRIYLFLLPAARYTNRGLHILAERGGGVGHVDSLRVSSGWALFHAALRIS